MDHYLLGTPLPPRKQTSPKNAPTLVLVWGPRLFRKSQGTVETLPGVTFVIGGGANRIAAIQSGS